MHALGKLWGNLGQKRHGRSTQKAPRDIRKDKFVWLLQVDGNPSLHYAKEDQSYNFSENEHYGDSGNSSHFMYSFHEDGPTYSAQN